MENHIKSNKNYLNPNLSLKILSKELNLSEGYISQLINKNSNLNFNDYINSLRITDAKNMLVDSEYNNYTILAIGLESGFNSKSSFYTAFKKFTGKTPVEYKKSVRNL
ncbi:helix-turn-helix domain-containing protein [uncultured Algibacter sp.]|uniref:helix-turn-helix domain-containing protein n=1 Tax=uncultured Algibacter sp. TaxID=298659 RepID=UPI00344A2D04